jgi:hypothetical protein
MFGEYYKDDGERTPLLHVQHAKDDRVAKHFIAMETHLQVKLIKVGCGTCERLIDLLTDPSSCGSFGHTWRMPIMNRD